MTVYAPALVLLIWSALAGVTGGGRVLSALGLILFAMAIWVHLWACRGKRKS